MIRKSKFTALDLNPHLIDSELTRIEKKIPRKVRIINTIGAYDDKKKPEKIMPKYPPLTEHLKMLNAKLEKEKQEELMERVWRKLGLFPR